MPRTKDLCFLGCPPGGNLHHFPDPKTSIDKFMAWRNALLPLLENIPISYISQNIRLCDKHFKSQYFTNTGMLTPNAAPESNIEMLEEYLDDTILQDQIPDNNVEMPIQKEQKVPFPNDEVSMYNAYSPSHLKVKPVTQLVKAAPMQMSRRYHEGFCCNICKKEIYGFRYVCIQCADWDMCPECEMRGSHPDHFVLRIPAPKPYGEIQYTLNFIRKELFNKDHQNTNASTPNTVSNVSRVENLNNVGKRSVRDPNAVARAPPARVNPNTVKVTPFMSEKTPNPTINLTSPPPFKKPNILVSNASENNKLFLEVTPIKTTPEPKTPSPNNSTPVKGNPLSNVSVSTTSKPQTAPQTKHNDSILKKPANPVKRKEDEGKIVKKGPPLKLVIPARVNARKLMRSLVHGPKVKITRLSEKYVTAYLNKR